MLLRTATLAMACALLAAGCEDDNQQKISDISAQEAINLVEENARNADFVILDVRTPEEFAQGHLANAVNMDYYAADFETRLQGLNKNAVYLVYCGSGMRSAKVIEMMRELGFAEAYNVLGGFPAIQVAATATCGCIFAE
jgi:rhodanese-related sulfurtransferase